MERHVERVIVKSQALELRLAVTRGLLVANVAIRTARDTLRTATRANRIISGSNPVTPASQLSLCGVISTGVGTLDIPAG
jgi:hypothetical protein